MVWQWAAGALTVAVKEEKFKKEVGVVGVREGYKCGNKTRRKQ